MISILDADTNRGSLRPMVATDLERILELRNRAEIRRYMLTQHEITLKEHAAWFERASRNPGLDLLVLEIDEECCGFVQFKETTYHGVVDWGFYVAPESSKGTGRQLGLASLKYIFNKGNIHKLCGQALKWNRNSIEFHKTLGFSLEGNLHEHHFDGMTYHDLICFGLLKHDWIASESLRGTRI